MYLGMCWKILCRYNERHSSISRNETSSSRNYCPKMEEYSLSKKSRLVHPGIVIDIAESAHYRQNILVKKFSDIGLPLFRLKLIMIKYTSKNKGSDKTEKSPCSYESE
jgi:hypothetical protein